MDKFSIGKRNEFKIWAYLLENGIDVYPTMVDDKGIDGLVGYNGNYFEIQIKSATNWTDQRGIAFAKLKTNLKRIIIVYNYKKNEIRYFTSEEILNEPKWEKTVKLPKWSQIPLNKHLLEKYSKNNLEGLIKLIKGVV